MRNAIKIINDMIRSGELVKVNFCEYPGTRSFSTVYASPGACSAEQKKEFNVIEVDSTHKDCFDTIISIVDCAYLSDSGDWISVE